MSDLRLSQGSGSFRFSDDAGTGHTISVHYHTPRLRNAAARLVFAMHGLDRAAEEFRDDLVVHAEAMGRTVIVPAFDAVQFPGVYSYNYGGACASPPDGAMLPRQRWTFGIFDRLVQRVIQDVRPDKKAFDLFGNSAGAQFVLRYLALMDADFVGSAVAANSGWYMLPDITRGYPVGMGGLDLDGRHVRRYFGRCVRVVLGGGDTDCAAHDLPRQAEAMAQGPHRLARGQWYFRHCAQSARDLHVDFGWRLMVVPGAGHRDREIFQQGLAALDDEL